MPAASGESSGEVRQQMGWQATKNERSPRTIFEVTSFVDPTRRSAPEFQSASQALPLLLCYTVLRVAYPKSFAL